MITKTAKLTTFWAFLLGVSIVASATTIDVSQNDLSDWGVTIPASLEGSARDLNNEYGFGNGTGGSNAPWSNPSLWAPTDPNVQWNWDDGRVFPATGGQNYDVETMYSYFDSNTNVFYFAMVTGFDNTGENSNGPNGGTFYAGDLYFNFGGATPAGSTVRYDTAVRIAAGGDFGTVYTSQNPDGTGMPFEDVWYTVAPHDHTIANPYRVDLSVNSDANLFNDINEDAGGLLGINWYNDVSAFDHNILQLAIQLDSTQAAYVSGVGADAHWTMQCGNDHMNWNPGPPPITEVPEPATMVLLGLGLAGIGLRRRHS